MGADNRFWSGESWTTWRDSNASNGFVVQAASNTAEMIPQRNDALAAHVSSVPVYVFLCVYPDDTQIDINQRVDTLALSNYIYDLVLYNRPLFLVLDIEDGQICGNWDTLSLTAAKSRITSIVGWISDRLDLWFYSGFVAYAAVPGVNGLTTSPTTTTYLAEWIRSGSDFPGLKLGVIFPQLFGEDTWGGNWISYWSNILTTYNNAHSTPYFSMNPSFEEDGIFCPTNHPQVKINDFYLGFFAAVGHDANIYTWYVVNCPWKA